MSPIRIFISSVQSEFADERAALRDSIRGDALIRRFFDVFLFEDAPASDRRPDALYLDEVERRDIYVGIFRLEYGTPDGKGIAPTGREFDRASKCGKHRLIHLKGAACTARDDPMAALIARAEGELVRKRFETVVELIGGLYAALVEYLDDNLLLRSGAFDADRGGSATVDDLDPDRMRWFVRRARYEPSFRLREDAHPDELLAHRNLLNEGRPTDAAVLLFGNAPQRHLISSEVKCSLSWHASRQADRVASGVQGHDVRSGGSGCGFRAGEGRGPWARERRAFM